MSGVGLREEPHCEVHRHTFRRFEETFARAGQERPGDLAIVEKNVQDLVGGDLQCQIGNAGFPFRRIKVETKSKQSRNKVDL